VTAELARVLVVNAGSSSLKLSVVRRDGSVEERGDIDRWNGSADDPVLRAFLERLDGAEHRPGAGSCTAEACLPLRG
jgi:hypothetical protein